MTTPLQVWDADYKGEKTVVKARDSYRAQLLAAIDLGVPASRQKHVRVKKR